MNKTISLLDRVHVASPCPASWAAMTGDDRSRFCGQCQKNVYNLSAMTKEAAEALIIEKEGRLCVRYYQRADGTIMTSDCPVGLRAARWAAAKMAGAVAALLGIALPLGCRMGAMAAPRQPTADMPPGSSAATDSPERSARQLDKE